MDHPLPTTTLDAPIFDPRAFRLTPFEADLTTRAREFGARILAPRAAKWDREAAFPIDNYRDMHAEGWLGVCIPREEGGLGADFRAYCIAAAELGRHCGATALTWNMHVCSTLWTGLLTDDLQMDPATRAQHQSRRALHYRRILQDGAIYSQPFSEGGAAAAGAAAFGTTAKRVEGGFLVNGKKIFASLSGHAQQYGILCTDVTDGTASRRNTLYLAIPADAPGVSVAGEWDPLGMRGTVSRNLLFQDVFVPSTASLMPDGLYFQDAMRWPHMFLTLSPTYMGLAQAAFDFTLRYLRGEQPMPGSPPGEAGRGGGTPPRQAPHVSHQADRGGRNARHARTDQGAVVPGDFRSRPRPFKGLHAARPRRAKHRHGKCQCHRHQSRAHLRRPGHAENPASGTHLPRQPLRFPHATLDCGTLHRPHRQGFTL